MVRPHRCCTGRSGPDGTPGPVERPEPDRVGGSLGRDEVALAVPYDEPPVEPELELDPLAGSAPSARPGRQLQDRRAGAHGAVTRDDAPVPERADPLEPYVGRQRPPGRDRVGRGDREPRLKRGR